MSILKNYKSSLILLFSMLLGGLFGYFFKEQSSLLQPLADLFLNFLYCVVVPMIFVSLIKAIANMTNLKKLAKLLGMILLITLITGVISAIFMAIFTVLLDPTKGAVLDMSEKIENLTSNSNFLAMFTVDDFPKLFSRRSLMALIVFTIASGIAVATLPDEKRKKVVEFFDIAESVITKLVGYIMKIAPVGLFALFAALVGDQGANIVGPLSRSILIYFAASVLYFILTTTLFGFIGAGKDGVAAIWRNIAVPTLTALGTCSSAASIPSNLVASQNIGISDEVKDLAIPLGANLHKDGAVLIQILKIAFFCSVYGINFLDPKNLLLAITISVIASTVMGAIPAGGYVGEIFIVSAFGFPPESIPIMVMIGTITDAPATAINVTGDIGMAMVIERLMNGKNWLQKKLEAKA